jgi:hypothetical protein
MYSVENPSNMVFNATAVPDLLNIRIEPDTWRKEGMALWGKYVLELDIMGVEPTLPVTPVIPVVPSTF